MSKIVYRKIACLVTNEGVVAKMGLHPTDLDLGLIHDAALVYSRKAGVLWTGKDKNLPKVFRSRDFKSVDCSALVAYPGLVDPHTHPVFGGDRSREFELRMRGATYQEIATAGGGIVNSVQNTRSLSLAALTSLTTKRFQTAYDFGVRLLEAKSGYGLSLSAEIKSLQAIAASAKKSKFVVVPTCMAAHAIPPEHKAQREKYIQEILEQILPAVAKKKLAQYVDVFCDAGYFSVDESLTIIKHTQMLGMQARVHGEELGFTGIAEKASAAGAHSVDHLLKIDDRGIQAMAKYGTVGVLLPATALYLREPAAPARKLIDAGVCVALATDFNPGSSPTQNLPFVGTLAALHMGMTTAEIIAALTWNGARSLRKEHEFGALLPGFKGEPIFAKGDHPSALFYHLAQGKLISPC